MGLEGLKSRKSSNMGPKRRCFGLYYTKEKKKIHRASLPCRLTDIEENGGEEEEEEEKRKKTLKILEAREGKDKYLLSKENCSINGTLSIYRSTTHIMLKLKRNSAHKRIIRCLP